MRWYSSPTVVLKSTILKAKKRSPLFQELAYMEKFCLKVGFRERQTATLISGKPLSYEGELYSEEHRRKFTTKRAGFQMVKAQKDKSKLALAINSQVIGEWFKEQFNKLSSSIRRTVTPLNKAKNWSGSFLRLGSKLFRRYRNGLLHYYW